MRKDAQRDRPVSKDEIVVTPDMVSAGVAELASWGRGDDLANIAEAVYTEMQKIKPMSKILDRKFGPK